MLRLAVVVLVLVLSPVAAWAERRVALVLAADEYRNIRPLENAVNDGRAIEEALDALGFEVFSETNRDLRRMRRALEDFREDAEGADVALVFFAGHGVEIAGENRLLPVDADAASLDALKDSSLPLEEVRETVAAIAKVGLVVLDACRNDPFGVGSGDGSGRGATALQAAKLPEVKPGLGRIGQAENMLFAFSAAPGATAADGSGGNSPFTAALVKYLGTDGLEIRSALTLVQQEVYDLSRGNQLPYIENGLPRLFFAAQSGELPERERLLLAMADLTPDLRNEVEKLAAEKDVPLAPLYSALIGSDATDLSVEERRKKLAEAADAFVSVRTQMRTMASTDPAVGKLREEAEQQLALGAFDAARASLAQAATIDSASRDALKANYVERTASEASTHLISGGASRADLNYDLALASFGKAAALFDEVDDAALSESQREQQLQAWRTLGDLFVVVGNLTEGRKAYERQLAVAERLAREADNPVWFDHLAAANLELGDVQRDQGDSAGALASYEKGLEVRRRLVEANPQDAMALRLEAEAHLQVGALYRLQGNADSALRAFIAARDIAIRLTVADPANDDLAATLAGSHSAIGDILMDRQDYGQALGSFSDSLAIARRLAQAGGDDPSRQLAMAEALGKVGYAQYKVKGGGFAGDGAKDAIASYDEAVAITRGLIESDAKNTGYQRALAGALERLGEAHYFGDNNITSEDSDNAARFYGEAIAIRELLSASDPTNKVWLADLVGAYEKQATWHVFRVEEDQAIAFSKKAHKAALDLAALDPQNVDWQRKASLYHAKISESYIQKKDYKSALDYEIAGLEYAIGIAKANPTMPVYFNDVTTMQERVARIYWVQKDFKNYWAQNDTVLEQAQRNEKRFPNDLDVLRHLYGAYLSVGDTWTKNEPQKALDLFANARTYAARAASLDPQNPEFLYGVYDAEIKSAYVIELKSDRAAAKAAYDAALATIEKAIALKPDETLYNAAKEHVLARLAIVESGQPPPVYE